MRHGPLFWPARYFDHHTAYSSFEVYSDEVNGDSLFAILDDARHRLLASELFDTTARYRLFICHDPQLYAKCAGAVKRTANTQGFHVHPLGYTFINLAYIEEVRRRNVRGHRYSILEGNAAHIIAHEVTHELIEEEVGFWEARRLPRWKVEGYCEYVAGRWGKGNDVQSALSDTFRAYLDGQYADEHDERHFYLRSGLLVRYYFDNLQGSFGSLMHPTTHEDLLLANVRRNLSAQDHSSPGR